MIESDWTEALRARIQRTQDLIEKSDRLIEDSKKSKKASKDLVARWNTYQRPIINNILFRHYLARGG